MKLYAFLLTAFLFSVITQPATARDGFDLGINDIDFTTHYWEPLYFERNTTLTYLVRIEGIVGDALGQGDIKLRLHIVIKKENQKSWSITAFRWVLDNKESKVAATKKTAKSDNFVSMRQWLVIQEAQLLGGGKPLPEPLEWVMEIARAASQLHAKNDPEKWKKGFSEKRSWPSKEEIFTATTEKCGVLDLVGRHVMLTTDTGSVIYKACVSPDLGMPLSLVVTDISLGIESGSTTYTLIDYQPRK
jgi:hypothetical protein